MTTKLCMGNGAFYVLKLCLPFGLLRSCEVGEIGQSFAGNADSNTMQHCVILWKVKGNKEDKDLMSLDLCAVDTHINTKVKVNKFDLH